MRSAFSLVLAVASAFIANVGAVPAANGIDALLKNLPVGTTVNEVAITPGTGVSKRQVLDLSGATCQTVCSGAPGTGPNQNDCDSLINGFLADGTQEFSVNNNIVLFFTLGSCKIQFVNFAGEEVTYQFNDFGSVASFLASDCNAAHGFGDGQCHFDEANAFIEVTHS